MIFRSKRSTLGWTVMLSFLLGMLACKNFVMDSRVSEGIVEYELTYPKLDESSPLKSFLPTEMTMEFKNNQFLSEISGAFGFFKTKILSYGDGEHFARTVKLIDKKYAVQFDPEMAKKSNSTLPTISLEPTTNTKKIAGYTCKEVIIHVNNKENETYTVYYTEEINIENPNWFTQFAKIKGVLMEYQIEKYNICTRFTAVSVESVEVQDDVFDIGDEYELVSEERLDKEVIEVLAEISK